MVTWKSSDTGRHTHPFITTLPVSSLLCHCLSGCVLGVRCLRLGELEEDAWSQRQRSHALVTGFLGYSQGVSHCYTQLDILRLQPAASSSLIIHSSLFLSSPQQPPSSPCKTAGPFYIPPRQKWHTAKGAYIRVFILTF